MIHAEAASPLFIASLLAFVFPLAFANELPASKQLGSGVANALTAPSVRENVLKSSPLDPFAQEIDGVTVVDQTVTVAGQDFYKAFVFFWNEKPMISRYAISIFERPSARLGNLIYVEFAHRRVFQVLLPTNRASVRELGDASAAATYEAVVNADTERLLFQDKDLGADEF